MIPESCRWKGCYAAPMQGSPYCGRHDEERETRIEARKRAEATRRESKPTTRRLVPGPSLADLPIWRQREIAREIIQKDRETSRPKRRPLAIKEGWRHERSNALS